MKARGYYGSFDSANQVKVQDVTLAEIKPEKEIQVNKPALVGAAYMFFDLLKKWDTAGIRRMSFDSVVCAVCEEPPRRDYENNLESLDSFFVTAKKYLPFSQLDLEIRNRIFTVSAREIQSGEENSLIKKTGIDIVYSVDFTVIENFGGYRSEQKHRFEFVKMNGSYKFYGMRTEENGGKYVRDY